jgi:NADH dehydrogenase FAD-containing subunit
MQFLDEKYPHHFAVGDIADTGLRKAARPGAAQAATVVKNILAMIEGRHPVEEYPRAPAGIHLTLGLVCSPRSVRSFDPTVMCILTEVEIQRRLPKSERGRGAD